MEEILASLISVDSSKNQQCPHYAFLNNSCIGCKKSVNKCNNPTTVPFRFIHRDLSLTDEAIRRLRDLNLQKLLHSKKLHLVLDLDHTLIHTETINKNFKKKKNNKSTYEESDVYEIFRGTTLVKLRPGTRDFLEKASQLFDLTIYTMAVQPYAKEIVKILETGPVQFSRVISRNDCTKKYRKSLDVVLSHQRVVLVVDDLDEVWSSEDWSNVIKIRPYEFFQTTSSSQNDDQELSRVLNILKTVHTKFYDKEQEKYEYYASKDVAKYLKRIKYDS
ncbi:RNA polymerase II C-terminal domain phosphatase-like 4 [Silene latifolia]|uniref:RNA polymerase II C-terminal domain phosphatase-like 4 n=1 Tax=Silene latifolia TaxID=37657 RepID=UPI003D77B3C7